MFWQQEGLEGSIATGNYVLRVGEAMTTKQPIYKYEKVFTHC